MKKSFFLIPMFAILCSAPVYAEEPEDMTVDEFLTMIEQEGDKYQKVDNDKVFAMMKNSLDAGESISLGKAFAMSEGLTIPSNFVYDLSETGLTGKLDASTVNYEFASLVSEMNMNQEQMKEDMSKRAKDATALFYDTYGDPLAAKKESIAAGYTLPKMELPEGYNYSSLISSAKSKVDSQFDAAFNSSSYQSIRNSINVSALFETAKAGLPERKQKTAADLQKVIDENTAGWGSDFESKSKQEEEDFWKFYNEKKAQHEKEDEARQSSKSQEEQQTEYHDEIVALNKKYMDLAENNHNGVESRTLANDYFKEANQIKSKYPKANNLVFHAKNLNGLKNFADNAARTYCPWIIDPDTQTFNTSMLEQYD